MQTILEKIKKIKIKNLDKKQEFTITDVMICR